ncbi:MAG: hypothetical protein ACJ8G1_20700 [Vitreoscilla sp.]
MKVGQRRVTSGVPVRLLTSGIGGGSWSPSDASGQAIVVRCLMTLIVFTSMPAQLFHAT